jgi:5-oxoprolinase (ATP-hydrolysing)
VDYALVAFGGAGAQHACALATRLGVKTVVVPEDAGLLSAVGLSGALIERFAERQVLSSLREAESRVPTLIRELAKEAKASLEESGIPKEETEVRRRIAEMRFKGQETTLQVEVDPSQNFSLKEAFASQYLAIYGHEPGERTIELVSLRVVASSKADHEKTVLPSAASEEAASQGSRKACFDGEWREVPVYDRESLRPGQFLFGPALVFEDHSATVVEPSWRLDVDGSEALVLCPLAKKKSIHHPVRPEAVRVELFSHRFEAMAREMGEALRRTAISTNVKERLDFSCALLDARGELVVNAPHIPVHLGSMGLCVRALCRVLTLKKGDVAITNHPVFGGSHLPDLTVIAPVYSEEGTHLGYTAARAHHAEIGGTHPGSMPPAATRLAEEGVVIPPLLLVKEGRSKWEGVERLLTEAPWPTRALDDNMADLKAAVAACHRGAEALKALAREHGAERVAHYMEALKLRAARRMKEALSALPDGVYEAEEFLDDRKRLKVKIDIEGERAKVDFTGSAGVHPGNLNATPAIVRSVVIYVLRLMVRENLPLNEGLMAPVTIILPAGMLNPAFPEDPSEAPSIVGGNVETSQRLVDTLMKALRMAAASQGTMNNVLFGNERFSYYETVCGGSGGGEGFHGRSAVHTHMTNTRITDPEVLEHVCPVRLDRFAVRRGTGGEGQWRGGDGVVREITFLEPLSLSILSQRRREGPFGMAGGGPGQPGAQHLVRADGTKKTLQAIDFCEVLPGDRLVLLTPGGGGYGKAGG